MENERLEAYYARWLNPETRKLLFSEAQLKQRLEADLSQIDHRKFRDFEVFSGLKSSPDRTELIARQTKNSRTLFKDEQAPHYCKIHYLRVNSGYKNPYSYAQIYFEQTLACIEIDFKYWEEIHIVKLLNRMLEIDLKEVPVYPAKTLITLTPSRWKILIYNNVGLRMLIYPAAEPKPV